MKETREEKLKKRSIKKPPFIIYTILMLVVKILNFRDKTSFTYKAYPNKEKGPFILISNHASRADYQFTGPVCYPNMLNYVVGYNEFFRFPLNIVLGIMNVIPKKNFTADIYCMQQIFRVIKGGGNICIMPEGMSSITGMSQPVIPGGAKMIKKLGVPVYFTKVSGGYLTYTKHCLDRRPGKVEVVVDQMFTAEDLKVLSVAEIENKMNELLAHDDYIWNKKEQISFAGNNCMAKQLDTLLYRCPKCNDVYHMKTDGNHMWCVSCGNKIYIDEKYNISAQGSEMVCPELVTDWTILERRVAKEMVSKEDFSFSEHIKIGKLPEYKLLKGDATSIICGDGYLTLDHSGLHFKGNKDNEPFTFHIKPDKLPTFGMCTDISRFYTFVDGSFIEFYPDNNDVLLWDHLVEENHRFCGGQWQNTPYRDYETGTVYKC